jgi:hypothetical protein
MRRTLEGVLQHEGTENAEKIRIERQPRARVVFEVNSLRLGVNCTAIRAAYLNIEALEKARKKN